MEVARPDASRPVPHGFVTVLAYEDATIFPGLICVTCGSDSSAWLQRNTADRQ
jgi:hypothetical protein